MDADSVFFGVDGGLTCPFPDFHDLLGGENGVLVSFPALGRREMASPRNAVARIVRVASGPQMRRVNAAARVARV